VCVITIIIHLKLPMHCVILKFNFFTLDQLYLTQHGHILSIDAAGIEVVKQILSEKINNIFILLQYVKKHLMRCLQLGGVHPYASTKQEFHYLANLLHKFGRFA
jgi:hypothetical protein